MAIDDWPDTLFRPENYGSEHDAVEESSVHAHQTMHVSESRQRQQYQFQIISCSRDKGAVFQFLRDLPRQTSPFNHALTKVCEDCSSTFCHITGLRVYDAAIASECELCTILKGAAQRGDSMQFTLMRAWLLSCDKSHECNDGWTMLSTIDPVRLLEMSPTRLVDVGLSNKSDLRLFCPEDPIPLKYAALSHCWGNPSEEHQRRYCTTDQNYELRKGGFTLAELPKTFRDAVRVTRELNIPYLWIDSLCIIQGNLQDWEQEAKRMEHVYKCAYVTLAATSATNSDDGFLHTSEALENLETTWSTRPLDRNFYYKFLEEVDNARLNSRAWVLQERLLSRRTIHFGKHHIYFECGSGICSDAFSTLTFPPGWKSYFSLDPDFPSRLQLAGHRSIVEFIESLFMDYTGCHLTQKTDRRVAIAGLEESIADSSDSKCVYGIFDRYLHRNLLWRRNEDGLATERIHYASCHVPSWSWMACTDSINYFQVPHDDKNVLWTKKLYLAKDNKYGQERHALIADVALFVNCTSEQSGASCTIYSDHITAGYIYYDTGFKPDLATQRCTVVSRWTVPRSRKKTMVVLFILVVTLTESAQEYTRIGAGWVEADYVAWEKANVRIV